MYGPVMDYRNDLSGSADRAERSGTYSSMRREPLSSRTDLARRCSLAWRALENSVAGVSAYRTPANCLRCFCSAFFSFAWRAFSSCMDCRHCRAAALRCDATAHTRAAPITPARYRRPWALACSLHVDRRVRGRSRLSQRSLRSVKPKVEAPTHSNPSAPFITYARPRRNSALALWGSISRACR